MAGLTNERGMMSVQVLGLCRGDGKGYVKINTTVDPVNLKASITMDDGSPFNCPVIPLDFPGEDESARNRHRSVSSSTYESVVVVPLLDNAKLTILVTDTQTGTEVGAIPFNPLTTKIKSRLTYRHHPELASQIRDIERRRGSGLPQLHIIGIFPAGNQRYSCRFQVRYPYLAENERCTVSIYDDTAHKANPEIILLGNSVVPNPQDPARRFHELTYSIIVDSNRTLCIQAKPDQQDACFTCVLPPMFDGLVRDAYELTKHASCDESYPQWFEQHRATASDIHNQHKHCASWTDAQKPLISIITVVFRPPVEYLQALINSFTAQSYDNFEVVFVNVSGNETSAEPINELLSQLSDPRFHVITETNRSIAENTNIGIREAHGDYIAFVDHDDVIEPDALYRYVCALHNEPTADVLYCDEDLLDNGQYRWPTFKPSYNVDLLYAHNYITHMLMVSRHVLEQVELSPADVSGAQDYDLTLKCCEKARAVVNVQYMLYHWRVHQNSTSTNPDSKPYAHVAGKIALERHFERIGLRVDVREEERPFNYRPRYIADSQPKVSIVIPVRNHNKSLHDCVESILTKTEYENYEIVLVENNSHQKNAFTCRSEDPGHDRRVSVAIWPESGFNRSAMYNFGAAQSDGEILLFLDHGMDVINTNWINSMSDFFTRPEVGVVGAKLIAPDGLVQHGGIWASSDYATFLNTFIPMEENGYMETLRYPNDCTAVSAACQMIRRTAFNIVDGFDEKMTGFLSGIDICLKINMSGYLTVFNPEARLYWNQPQDTIPQIHNSEYIEEKNYFNSKWYQKITGDLYVNHNINPRDTGNYKIA